MNSKALACCSSCGKQYEVETLPAVNTARNPELKASVKDGSLFVKQCPHCGNSHLVSYPFLYHDPDVRLIVWLLPEGADGYDEASVEQMSAQVEALEDYTVRRVATPGELIEKIGIADAGLDDRAVELCKFVTEQEMEERIHPDGPLRFYRMDGADNEITFTFPSGGQMMSLNIGFNVYEDCLGILRRNSAILSTKGFARIDGAWVNRFMR